MRFGASAPGAAGPPGSAGPPGAKGVTGRRGVAGSPGAKGDPGAERILTPRSRTTIASWPSLPATARSTRATAQEPRLDHRGVPGRRSSCRSV